MSLIIGPGDTKVEVGVFCGWETASSQIRICIVLSALYNTFLAYRSIMNESKTLADRVSSCHLSSYFVLVYSFSIQHSFRCFCFV